MSQSESKALAAVDFLNFVPATLTIQNEFFHTVETANRDWLARAQSEAKLISDFVGNLTTAGSIPDATSACQDCAARQFEMFAEDSCRFMTDRQRVIDTGMRFLSAPVASL